MVIVLTEEQATELVEENYLRCVVGDIVELISLIHALGSKECRLAIVTNKKIENGILEVLPLTHSTIINILTGEPLQQPITIGKEMIANLHST